MHRALRVLQWRQSAVKRKIRIFIEGGKRTCATTMGRSRSWPLGPKADVGHQGGKRPPSMSAKGGQRKFSAAR